MKFLLKDKYESLKKIINVKSPVLVMHGKKDKIVPFSMGKRIFEISNEPKYSYFTQTDDHMMEYDNQLINVLNRFIKSLN